MNDEEPMVPEAGAEAVQTELEQRLAALEASLRERLLRAELKGHAIRAGMVDLDGLKLLDISRLALNDNDEVVGAAELMAEARWAKPWLFGGASTSSAAAAPPAQAPKAKLATDMTEAEWRASCAAAVRRCACPTLAVAIHHQG